MAIELTSSFQTHLSEPYQQDCCLWLKKAIASLQAQQFAEVDLERLN